MTGRRKAVDPPQCVCGGGQMVLRCAGDGSWHPGRYFYVCPTSVKHPDRFFWCDEYHRHDPPESVPEFLSTQTWNSDRGTQSSNATVGCDRNTENPVRRRGSEEVCDNLPRDEHIHRTNHCAFVHENMAAQPIIWLFLVIAVMFIFFVLVLLGVLLGMAM
ncbi:hypothetical protein ACS0TY_024606 [Phlomoides rotata]